MTIWFEFPSLSTELRLWGMSSRNNTRHEWQLSELILKGLYKRILWYINTIVMTIIHLDMTKTYIILDNLVAERVAVIWNHHVYLPSEKRSEVRLIVKWYKIWSFFMVQRGHNMKVGQATPLMCDISSKFWKWYKLSLRLSRGLRRSKKKLKRSPYEGYCNLIHSNEIFIEDFCEEGSSSWGVS